MASFNHFEGCVKSADDRILQCPWKLTSRKHVVGVSKPLGPWYELVILVGWFPPTTPWFPEIRTVEAAGKALSAQPLRVSCAR